MKVQVVNKRSDDYGRVGCADESAWNLDKFWIPVTMGKTTRLFAKMYLVEV